MSPVVLIRRILTVVVTLVVALTVTVGTATATSRPSSPQNPWVAAGNAKATIHWSAPAQTGGMPIDQYRVQRAVASTGPWITVAYPDASTRVFTNTGLKNGKTYYFRVRAHNAIGWSAPSATVSCVPRKVPSAPQDVEASPGEGSVTIAWQAPTRDGGATIDHYLVQSRATGTTTWSSGSTTIDGTARSLITSGLSAGTTYEFQVRAHNVAGYGARSVPATATPLAAPRVVAADAMSANQVLVIFDHAIDPTSVNASSFTLDGGLTVLAANVSGTSVTVTTSAQQPGVTYTVTASTNVVDTNGLHVDPTHQSATFTGYAF